MKFGKLNCFRKENDYVKRPNSKCFKIYKKKMKSLILKLTIFNVNKYRYNLIEIVAFLFCSIY